ncbi:hypothetical protein GCM10028771_19230 [Nocardioides marmoraquaticus]
MGRRGVLAAGSAALLAPALAACTSTSGADGDVAPSGDGTPSLSPDVALATLALAELRAAAAAVAATTRGFPALRTSLAPVREMHEAHEAALVDAVLEGAEPGTDPAAYVDLVRRRAALTALRRREQELQARLGDLAVEARSGAFAALLAAMSAGTAQRVATWPT